MKFGVLYEHQLPRPRTASSECDLLQPSLDQFQFADQLGYDYARVVEHHFLEEYSNSSAPEMFLGAASQRTKNIRLGQVILLNQAGRTTHQAICDSLELFSREVMPEFHERQQAQDAGKVDVLAGRITLEELEADQYDLYAHPNEDIVGLTPEQFKQPMAVKERAVQGAD